ncbi:hypothetical protein SDC9_07476 [bioreactor metagenome]|uniref:Uncharacterized protein n=1 Tax=bioreactor metagenome TaxID=1076179 RepID=A0A644T5V3_9ZZZZ
MSIGLVACVKIVRIMFLELIKVSILSIILSTIEKELIRPIKQAEKYNKPRANLHKEE